MAHSIGEQRAARQRIDTNEGGPATGARALRGFDSSSFVSLINKQQASPSWETKKCIETPVSRSPCRTTSRSTTR